LYFCECFQALGDRADGAFDLDWLSPGAWLALDLVFGGLALVLKGISGVIQLFGGIAVVALVLVAAIALEPRLWLIW
jgi:hypothetical protein